jgi:tetratricopeptide (TPR) repeat protein
MPTLQEVEQFKAILNELGDEPEVLAERGEEIEDVPPPEQGLPAGLSDLLDTEEQAGAPGAEEAPVTGEQAGSGEPEGDFGFEETAGQEAAGREAAGPPAGREAPAAEEQIDLSGLASEEEIAGLDILEGLGFPSEEQTPGEPEAPAEKPADVTFPVEELETPETPQPGETAPPEAAEPAEGEEEAFELPEEFQLPEAEEGEQGPAGQAFPPQAPPSEALETGEEPQAAAEIDEFAIPPGLIEPSEGEDLGLPEGEAQAPGGEGEAGEGEFELPEMPGFDLENLEVEGPQPGEAQAPAEGPEPAGEEAFEFPVEEGPAGEPFEMPPVEEAAGEEAFEMPPPEQAPAEQAFELPEDFQLPEEGFEEAAVEEPAEGEPSEEEADFLRVLQEEIFPGEEAPGEAEAGQAPEEAAAAAAPSPGPPVAEQAPSEAEAAFAKGEQVELEAEAEAPEAAEEFALEEFSLEGLGEPFAVEEPQKDEAAAPEAAEELPAEEAGIEEEVPEQAAAAGAEEMTFTEKQFSAIRRSLSRLPRNLKLAIEELIAERGLAGEELRSLLALLIEGAAPAAIAGQVSRLTGRRIVLPKSFERLSGIAFEEERRTFTYAFRENILPLVRVVLLSLLFLGLLGFLGYRYVYKPLYANHLYHQGYRQIAKERYRMANDSFDRATSTWPFKSWFYRYADAFTGQRQYQLAAEKYDQLLDRFPADRRGILDYSYLLTHHLAGYEKADALLEELLEENMRDRDALLAKGDNFLEWAEEDPSRYADARFAYASIIDYYGERDEVLLRMMRYFIRTDKLQETVTLKAYLDSRRKPDVETELYASTYAELSGYWMDNNRYDQVQDMLFKAMDVKPDVPAIHYQLARYYRRVNDPGEEELALDTAIGLLERMQPLDKKHLAMLIDAHNRRGETFWRREEYLLAEEHFQSSITMIEDAQRRRIFGLRKEFGLVYKNYGDIYYYVSHDLEPALDLYLKAANNRYADSDLDYKMGYIHYAADRYEEALLSFSKVVDEKPTNENALYALANSLYLRGYYSSAQGYYLRLLNLLEAREERIPLLQIYENPEHQALEEDIMKVYNNLGVTLKRLADRSRDPEKDSKALVNMTFSSERFDLLSRDPQTAERGLTRNLAYLNQRGVLYPASDFELQIYSRLPIDPEASSF